MMGYDKQIIKRAAGQAENFLKTGKWINTPVQTYPKGILDVCAISLVYI